LPSADGQVQVDKVGSMCSYIWGYILFGLSVLVFTCFSAIYFLIICFLHQFQLLGIEPEDFGVNWNSSKGPEE
jgi:hypothetical protein